MNVCPSLCALLLVSCAAGQVPQPAPPKPPDPAAEKALAEVLQRFRAEGIEIDTKAQTVTIPAVVNDPPDPIEYLLVHKRGKRHEAVFWTRSKPSVLNAALLMLGFEPGKNASYVEKDPPPTLEQIEAGADPIIVTPPSGMPVWLTVRWKDKDGKEVEHCVEDVLLDLATQKAVTDCSWVYLGGRMARLYRDEPEVYVADLEGNVISTCYMMPENHLVTMVHERARDEHNWWITSLLPPPGTEVAFVLHRSEPELHKQRAARLANEPKAAGAPPSDQPPK